ncbi:MAG: hypothetical protein FWF52_03910 [Candidatus Azobacteroides sp.]|nr:hypothetical protein [Candidatus Azobacteroides sp.]
MKSIIEIEEASPNNWHIKIKGRREAYAINIIRDGDRMADFQEKDEAREKIETEARDDIDDTLENTEVELTTLLRNVPVEKLCDYVVQQIKQNLQLLDSAFKITTAQKEKIMQDQEDDYFLILREVVEKIKSNRGNTAETETAIEEMSQWREKIRQYVEQKNYDEAVFLSKVFIEAVAEWMNVASDEILESIDKNYLSVVFDVFHEVVLLPQTDIDEWFCYCQSEKNKPAYRGTSVFDRLNELSIQLMAATDPEAFAAMQRQLSFEMQDKCSLTALQILNNKKNYYLQNGQSKKAWEQIEKTIQLEQFRENLQKRTDEKIDSSDVQWDEHLLGKAQEEKDTFSARKMSFEFIKDHFHKSYYAIYKFTFTPSEWPEELEKLLQRYGRDSETFNPSVADVLIVENAAEQLAYYIERHLSVERIEKYYLFFVGLFPDKTLELFRTAIDAYIENNAGPDAFAYVISLLKKMLEIENGKECVAEITREYIVRYRNRRDLVEGLRILL